MGRKIPTGRRPREVRYPVRHGVPRCRIWRVALHWSERTQGPVEFNDGSAKSMRGDTLRRGHGVDAEWTRRTCASLWRSGFLSSTFRNLEIRMAFLARSRVKSPNSSLRQLISNHAHDALAIGQWGIPGHSPTRAVVEYKHPFSCALTDFRSGGSALGYEINVRIFRNSAKCGSKCPDLLAYRNRMRRLMPRVDRGAEDASPCWMPGC